MGQRLKLRKYKRFVSKAEYVYAQSKRASKGFMGLGIWLAAMMCAILTLGFLCGLVACLWYMIGKQDLDVLGAGGFCLFCAFMSGGAVYLLRSVGMNMLNEAREIDPGIPLTRANAADLPAPDSLIRASEEPVKEQQAVLLRAATETQEKHDAQLLRASAGGQK